MSAQAWPAAAAHSRSYPPRASATHTAQTAQARAATDHWSASVETARQRLTLRPRRNNRRLILRVRGLLRRSRGGLRCRSAGGVYLPSGVLLGVRDSSSDRRCRSANRAGHSFRRHAYRGLIKRLEQSVSSARKKIKSIDQRADAGKRRIGGTGRTGRNSSRRTNIRESRGLVQVRWPDIFVERRRLTGAL